LTAIATFRNRLPGHDFGLNLKESKDFKVYKFSELDWIDFDRFSLTLAQANEYNFISKILNNFFLNFVKLLV
jgi:chloramphenicol O-acetyltransferase